MKRVFLLIGLLFVLSSYTIKVEDDGYFAVKYETTQVSGMTYMIVYNKYTRASGGVATGVSVVNVTKDRLECDYYKKMLKN